MIPKSKTLPRHIAIIMDGNRRWAEQKKLSKIKGHRAGLDALEKVIKACAKSDIEALTLYVFSAENWKRSKIEVDTLLSLFEENIKANFGIDVYVNSFPKCGYDTYDHKNLRLLVMRSEIKDNEKAKVIRDFLRLSKFQLSIRNSTKRAD